LIAGQPADLGAGRLARRPRRSRADDRATLRLDAGPAQIAAAIVSAGRRGAGRRFERGAIAQRGGIEL